MDRIEQYYRQHKDELDMLEPEADSWLWLDRELDRGKVRPFRLWISAAAVVLIALGIGWSFLQMAVPDTAGETQTVEVGDKFPEIALRNPFGELVPLSSLQGKVVLVEFWASYSKVCTEENCYYFLPLYEQYKDQGFEIYGVSVDTSAQHWLAGIERDALPWIQVADIGQPEPATWQQFDVESLPTTFLLDQEGRVVAKNVDRDELGEYLEEMLASR